MTNESNHHKEYVNMRNRTANADSDSFEFNPVCVQTETSIFVPASQKATVPSMSIASSVSSLNREQDKGLDKSEWNSDCNVCSKSCLTIKSKMVHVPNHLNIEDGLPCPFCARRFRSYGFLGRHLLKAHDKSGGCNNWLSREVMDQFRQITRDKVKEFFSNSVHSSKNNLKKSSNILSEKQTMKASCNLCSDIFDKKYQAIFHAETHMGSEDSLCCPHCPKNVIFRCKAWSSMKLHLSKFHKKFGSLYDHLETHILIKFRERVREKVRDCFGDSFNSKNDDENENFDNSSSFDASPIVFSKAKEVIRNTMDEETFNRLISEKNKRLEETIETVISISRESCIDSVEQTDESDETNFLLMCRICSRSVRSRQFERKSHAKSHMDNESRLLCHLCSTPNYFCYEISLRRHLIKVHKHSGEWRKCLSITSINRFYANVDKKELECFGEADDNVYQSDSPEPSPLVENNESIRMTVVDLTVDEETETRRKSMKLTDSDISPVSVILSRPSELASALTADDVAPVLIEEDLRISTQTSIVNVDKNIQIEIRPRDGMPLTKKRRKPVISERTSKDKTKHICRLCNITVSLPLRHICTRHLKTYVFKCNQCSYGLFHYESHENRHHTRTQHPNNGDAKIINCTDDFAKEIIELSQECFGTEALVCHKNPFLNTTFLNTQRAVASVSEIVLQSTSPTSLGSASHSAERNTSPLPPTNFPPYITSTPITMKDTGLSIIEIDTELENSDDDVEEIDTDESFASSDDELEFN